MRQFYHASNDFINPGTVMTGRYRNTDWRPMPFHEALEKCRPADKLPQSQSVFFCDCIEDVDLAGGGGKCIVIVELEKPARHDINWGSEISALIEEEGLSIDSDRVKAAAEKYWDGTPHDSGESIWEYMVPEATVLACYAFEGYEDARPSSTGGNMQNMEI